MRCIPDNFPFPLFELAPPYLVLKRLSDAVWRDPSLLPAGSVIVVQNLQRSREWPLLAQSIPGLRQRFPMAPVVLHLPSESRTDIHHVARCAGRLYVRAVLSADDPIAETLRRELTRPEDLAGDVAEWLGLVNPSLSPILLHLVRQIFTYPPEEAELSAILKRSFGSEAGARARFRKRRLPSPCQWLHVARAIHAALHIQASPEKRLCKVALDLGYTEQSAFNHLVRRSFGLTPKQIRGTLGWEWMLYRWLSTAGRTEKQLAI
jgi:AraC-like DNA-binding protein